VELVWQTDSSPAVPSGSSRTAPSCPDVHADAVEVGVGVTCSCRGAWDASGPEGGASTAAAGCAAACVPSHSSGAHVSDTWGTLPTTIASTADDAPSGPDSTSSNATSQSFQRRQQEHAREGAL